MRWLIRRATDNGCITCMCFSLCNRHIDRLILNPYSGDFSDRKDGEKGKEGNRIQCCDHLYKCSVGWTVTSPIFLADAAAWCSPMTRWWYAGIAEWHEPMTTWRKSLYLPCALHKSNVPIRDIRPRMLTADTTEISLSLCRLQIGLVLLISACHTLHWLLQV